MTFTEPGRPPRTLDVDEPWPVVEIDRYDRLRVLVTELARVAATPDGRVEVLVHGHLLRRSRADDAGADRQRPRHVAHERAVLSPGEG